MDTKSYTASVKRLYVSILILTFGVGYFTFQECDRATTVARSIILDAASSIYQFISAGPDITRTRPFSEQDLTKVSKLARIRNATAVIVDIMLKSGARPSDLPPGLEKFPKPYKTTRIPGASLADFPPTHFSPRADCTAAVFRGSENDRLSLVDTSKDWSVLSWDLSNAYFVYFSWTCELGITSAILFRLPGSDPHWLVGLPVENLPTLLEINNTADNNTQTVEQLFKRKPNILLDNYPQPVLQIIKPEKSYSFVDHETVEAAIFRQARLVTGIYRAPGQIAQAMDDIATVAETYTNIAGVHAPIRFLIHVAPLILAALIYLLYLRVRVLVGHWREIKEPWLFRESRESHEIWIAYTVAMFPALASILVFGAFALLTGAGVGRSALGDLLGFSSWRLLQDFYPVDSFVVSAMLVVFVPTFIWSIIICRQLLLSLAVYRHDQGNRLSKHQNPTD